MPDNKSNFRRHLLFLRALSDFLILFCFCIAGTTVVAQTPSKLKRVTVAVGEVKTEVISDFAEIQGRLVASVTESVTATVSSEIKILDLKLGDTVSSGQSIAQQKHDNLIHDRLLLETQLAETKIKNADIMDDIESDMLLLELAEQQLALLNRKANRAKSLAANNAAPIDAAETALSNSLSAKQRLLSQTSSLARKKTQLAVGRIIQDRLQVQIKQLNQDIAATRLRAQITGQLIFLFDDRRGFARKGEVVARILDPSIFEVEVEVPVRYLSFLQDSKTIQASTLAGYPLTLSMRVVMPVQNSRTATRIVRFKLPTTTEEMVFAENAVVKVQLPMTSPLPALVVPKDAVIPVSDGHIVYLFKNGKAMRRNISLGQAVASGFIVRSGLQDGDIVVTRGNEQLSDGIHIEFVSEKAKAYNKVNN